MSPVVNVGSTSLKMLTANLARYGGQLALLVVIAQSAGPEAVGRFALALAITAPIFILTGLGMRTIIITLKAPFAVSDVFAVRCITTGIAVIASLLAALVVPSADWAVVALVAAIKATESFSDAVYGLHQLAGRFTSIPIFAVTHAGVYVSASLAGAWATGDVLVALACGAAASILVVAPITAHTVRAAPAMGLRRETGGWPARWALAKAGVPSGIAEGMISLVTAMPQLVLAEHAGTAATGRYAVLIYIMLSAELVMNAINQAWLPTARRAESNGLFTPRFMGRFLGKVTALQLPLAALILAGATVVFPPLFGEVFALRAPEYFPLAVSLLCAPALYITGGSMSVKNLYPQLMRNSGIVLAVCVIGSLVVVPSAGITGALWVSATCVALRGALAAATVTLRSRRPVVVSELACSVSA